ncbi:MAG: hypothetical protein IT484_07875 [Gammaproteobacteria bacterium]|nr:hypothetical protein [Gammaproteobacteria bacterium]
MHFLTRPIAIALLGAALTAPAVWADPAAETSGPAAIVTAFNAAVTAKDLQKAATYFAPGSVQFTLRQAHPGMGGDQAESLSGDLRSHWMMVGSTVIAATKSYSRTAEITGNHADGDIATVWAKITTMSHRSDQPEAKKDEFTEVYLMVRKDGHWLIGAVADNRKPNVVAGGRPN